MPDPPPRPEYPRPLLVRPGWSNLNGSWELGFDPSDRGLREGWERGRPFEGRIQVPYPIGSELSGCRAPEDPLPVVWYRRRFRHAPTGRGARGAAARTLLRIGACDFATRVFVNGQQVGAHRGGYSPIACEVGHVLRPGENEVVLRVEDPATWSQPRGKQAAGAARSPVDYDAITGVWQTVWLEDLPEVSIDEIYTCWSRASGELAVHGVFSELWDGEVEVALYDHTREVARATGSGFGRREVRVVLRPPGPREWSPEDPHLYALRVELRRGAETMDLASSYTGLRELATEDGRILLNGKPLYVRGVLDQGYFPGGWYAAARDEDLRRDVELTRALGFNCARKHQKVEDPRYLYWADTLGLLVWGEMPSGRDFCSDLVTDLSREWLEVVRRDRGHPSLMAWVPFNESWGVWQQARRVEQRAFVEGLAGLTRALDPTRLVVANDGWEYTTGDLWTLHLYEGEPDAVSARLDALLADPATPILRAGSPLGERLGALAGADVAGLPVLLSECGGIGFRDAGTPEPERPAFAYGDLPKTQAELEARIRAVADLLRDRPELSGFVWTQLSDVQQEINGLVTFDRQPKLPLPLLRSIFEEI
ncbi:MAG: glycoside hydrolase family 2 TIM barrel-domain containing protein [Myxococcota bacterium]